MSEGSSRRVAMWAGPPNVATALMRSWGNRSDTHVWDEPFYPYYLKRVAPDHTISEEVLQHHESDPVRIAESLLGPLPEGKAILYEKQMAQYLLPEIDRGWIEQTLNCFLIQEPRSMVATLARHMRKPKVEDTGLSRQVELFELARETAGRVPPVIDVDDLLADPAGILRQLCERIGVAFEPSMLRWEPGSRPTDGVWGKHFYRATVQSTGFPVPVSAGSAETIAFGQMAIYADCLDLYKVLHKHRLGASDPD